MKYNSERRAFLGLMATVAGAAACNLFYRILEPARNSNQIRSTTEALANDQASADEVLSRFPSSLVESAVRLSREDGAWGSGYIWEENDKRIIVISARHVFEETYQGGITLSQPQFRDNSGTDFSPEEISHRLYGGDDNELVVY